ncbi:MAG: glycosyltransferase [Caldiserica bacterium]|nr:glycosyltransferase [Caldisericota bacterium]
MIERYITHAGAEAIAEIVSLARGLQGLRVLHVNSTYHGGGVAGMLRSLVPLMNEVGLDADWTVLFGEPKLFSATKKFHNALQGEEVFPAEDELDAYFRVNEFFARYAPFDHDLVVIHDPQPLPTISFREKREPWVWRCHIDLSAPEERAWDLLRPYILRYDAVVVSSEAFRKEDLPTETFIVPPAIDPLSDINRELSPAEVEEKLAQYGVPTDKPLIVQVSRFDKWKDPLGVLEVYRRLRDEADARLVMLGNMAGDDPEGPEIFARVRERAAALPDVHLITETDELLVNALQRAAAAVVQLSTREGFGLTVSEALWKGTPVVATAVGGIPLQVRDGETGFLVAPGDYDAAAGRVLELLRDEDLRRELGTRGREHVRENFLITRLLRDWLSLIRELLG